MARKSEPSFVRPKSVTRDDVGVREAARRLGLALEAARELVLAAELGQEDLDGEVLAHHRVLGAVDGAHAAHAEAAHDAVAIADDGADERIEDGRAAARTERVLELDLLGAARAAGHAPTAPRGAGLPRWIDDDDERPEPRGLGRGFATVARAAAGRRRQSRGADRAGGARRARPPPA